MWCYLPPEDCHLVTETIVGELILRFSVRKETSGQSLRQSFQIVQDEGFKNIY